METREQQSSSMNGGTLLMGVAIGGAIATGIALYFSPRLRQRLASSAEDLRNAASAGVQTVENKLSDVLERAADAADDVTLRAQSVRDDVAGAVQRSAHVVVQGAREVEHFAKALKTDPVENRP